MTWNWQLPGWPNFRWDEGKLQAVEVSFRENVGFVMGATSHLSAENKEALLVEFMCVEALDTSEIEGEFLNRDSVQSSIRRALGLAVEYGKPAKPAEVGVAEMMANLYQTSTAPLTETVLFHWHNLLMQGRKEIKIGAYRDHAETMQIVSGPDYARKIHFEAPPSVQVSSEMNVFLEWLVRTAPTGETPLPILTRAGIAHLWFESIHPFEDGNGRIGRAIAEKILSQRLRDTPCITNLSKILLKRKSAYYANLNAASKTLDITDWLYWFSLMVIEAQGYVQRYVHFILEKSTLLEFVRGKLNLRQEKVVYRMLREGPDGFLGGLSAANYMSLTGATTATTTRDLGELVKLEILERVGEKKATRYHLCIATKAAG
ncbi:MAG: Fic family protein [Pseudomonadota bacterium]